MAAFKCKMCGGTIEFEPGASIGVCDSCGTKQTLPRLDDDKRANLYDRANHFRRNNDFDKAMGIYEQILSEDADDAEAYWSLVLCRYGIEYVEDPATHKRVPTVNRAQYTSVFADADYKSAVAHADDAQRAIYEAEAKAIDEIQKGILEISGKEEPFDVFICYKETDANGRRTQDSVLANDLYHQLTQEGFKVFFARITLVDKLGSAYEPYIFAALNSAKVMVVLGTKPEYFNAVWVKNEWSRYLALVKQSGGKKMLIPAYKDMDPYDLPDEFSHLQAQDMAKLGFMQDLIRGIKKILAADSPKSAAKETVILNGNGSTAPLLKRVFLFLEDGNWAEADEYCEKVLDLDPECAEAYLGKLMAELQVKNQKELAECFTPFEDNVNYAKIMRFGDSKLTAMLTDCVATQPQKIAYKEALNAMSLAAKSDQKSKMYRDAGVAFSEIGDFKDAQALAQKCFEKAEACRKAAIYDKALIFYSWDEIKYLKGALKQFESIPGWEDADEKAAKCKQRIEELTAKEEREAEEKRAAARWRKKAFIIITAILCVFVALILLWEQGVVPNRKYKEALSLLADGNPDNLIQGYEQLIALNGFKDSEAKAAEVFDQYKVEKLKNPAVGDIVYFGKYEQDNDASNGAEDIEWIVLAKKEDSYLVITKYALDCIPYNEQKQRVTWQGSTLRNWLNYDFLDEAFTDEETSAIIIPNYDIGRDKVFLLSTQEAAQCFADSDARKCTPTDYAIAKYVETEVVDGKVTCSWWLRSPGSSLYKAAYVNNKGEYDSAGNYIQYAYYCVRPVLWISIKH